MDLKEKKKKPVEGKFIENEELEYSSVQKAISILLAFIPDNKPKGNQELSQTLGLNKSTVSRLVQVLIHYGLIQQDEETRKFALGRTSAQLGMAVEVSQNQRLAQYAQPFIESLRDAVGESVCLEALVSGQGKIISGAIGPPPLSASFPESNPMHVSAGAKAILAFLGDAVVDSMIHGEFKRMTENTITDPEVFKDHLEEIKQQGVAYDHAEANPDIHAVAAPIFNHLKKPIAAITICVPATRVNKILNKSSVDLLKKTARRISDSLFLGNK